MPSARAQLLVATKPQGEDGPTFGLAKNLPIIDNHWSVSDSPDFASGSPQTVAVVLAGCPRRPKSKGRLVGTKPTAKTEDGSPELELTKAGVNRHAEGENHDRDKPNQSPVDTSGSGIEIRETPGIPAATNSTW